MCRRWGHNGYFTEGVGRLGMRSQVFVFLASGLDEAYFPGLRVVTPGRIHWFFLVAGLKIEVPCAL